MSQGTATAQHVIQSLQDHDAQFLHITFTDMVGQWHRISYHTRVIDEKLLTHGVLFDGSSIPGWKAIHESDMLLKPDLSTLMADPFAAQPTMMVIADVLDPRTGKTYDNDPRTIAKRAGDALRASKIATEAYFGPEPEFFIFDSIRYQQTIHGGFYAIDSDEMDYASARDPHTPTVGNSGHRPGRKGGYLASAPADTLQDMRAEMISVMHQLGLPIEKHHHEVATAQHELGLAYGPLVGTADTIQLYKYVVKSVANTYGKTATFMPKPMRDDNGSGMHVHQSLWFHDKPLFAGEGYAGLSELALFYIGGIIKHARAINAFTNPTTNSYKRLVPGFEAPVLLAYAQGNRSAACRIPVVDKPAEKRIEVRFPDPSANPYLGLTAMLMAGLDGIHNKIHPGQAMDHDLYQNQHAYGHVPTVAGSLSEALDALHHDRAFLTQSGVMTDAFIDAYIALKEQESRLNDRTPTPIEFTLYYGC